MNRHRYLSFSTTIKISVSSTKNTYILILIEGIGKYVYVRSVVIFKLISENRNMILIYSFIILNTETIKIQLKVQILLNTTKNVEQQRDTKKMSIPIVSLHD